MVKQAYGMTELSPAIMINPTNNIKTGSVGVLCPNMNAKVVDPKTKEELGKNADGEIWVNGPNLMKGYLGKPQKTIDTMSEDSKFLKTGDIGHVDDDGYWFIVDRLKELIKYKGFQVPPAELEALLLKHDSIADCAVVGVPDEEAGELPKAYIVLKEGSELSEDDIVEWVASRVAPHKKLRGGVEFTDKIPKSASGKILHRVLRDIERKKQEENNNSN
eukprot:TRINITY_DN9210_c0_g1_i1.p1 TRINITY_DN9210_c0_g1~~TRINITY_DN9210_c0_g1_i1.p1  ORF type:complete len:218 (-),score=113.81 TRINITY_DN9210_c0_g1_i1:35-688(-)